MEPTTTRADSATAATLPQPAPDMYRFIASPWHLLLVMAVQGTLSYRSKIRMDHLQTLADPNRIGIYKSTIFFEWAVLALVLIGVWWHGSSLLTVLGPRWRSPLQALRDAGIGLLFLIVTIAFGSILGHGADNPAARMILPHAGEMWLWVALSVSAGICEEAIYRGYLQRQCIAITGNVPAGIVLSAVAFGAVHSYQGLASALRIGLLGLLGGILAHWCKSVRPGMIAHTLQDILGGFIRH